MNLGRILRLLTVFLGVVALTVVALQIVAKDVVTSYERQLSENKLNKVSEYFESEKKVMLQVVSKWAEKKQFETFFKTRKKEELNSLLNRKSFADNQLNFIALIDDNGKVIFSHYFKTVTRSFTSLPGRIEYQLTRSSLREQLQKKPVLSGYIAAKHLYGVALSPVFDKHDNVLAWLALGRRYSEPVIRRANLVNIDLSMINETPDKQQQLYLKGLKEKPIYYHAELTKLSSVKALQDIFGDIRIFYLVKIPRFNFDGVVSMSWFSVLVFAGVGFMLVMLTWIFGKKNLKNDLQRLSRDIQNIKVNQDHFGRLDLKGRYLLADLVKDINKTIGGLEQTQDSLAVKNRMHDAEVLLDMLPVEAYMKDCDRKYVMINRHFCEITGLQSETLFGRTNEDIKSEFISDEHEEKEQQVFETEMPVVFEEQVYTHSLGTIYYQTHLIPMRNNRGAIEGIVGVRFDITSHKRAESEMVMASRVLENTAEGVMVTNADSRIIHVNPAYTHMTGYTEEEVLGKVPLLLQSEIKSRFYQDIQNSLKDKGEWHGELWSSRKDGSSYPEMISIKAIKNQNDEIINYFSMSNDITEMKEVEQKLYQMAHYDSLTGLPNRVLFKDRLSQEIKRAQRNKKNIGVLFLDLDLFKSINDSLGHAAGDSLLKVIAERLGTTLRKGDSIARLGGDEFTIMVADLASDYGRNVGYLTRVCEKISDVVNEAVELEGRQINITSSIGVTVYPNDGEDVDDLLRNADTAMYYAKSQGRRNYQFYSKEFNEQAVDRLEKEIEFRSALKKGELSIYFQPQVDMISRHVVGAEALLRWRKDGVDIMPPDQVVSLAEETGLIYELGEWILMTACQECKRWLDMGHKHLRVAVNLSTRQFRQKKLVNKVEQILERTKLPPRLLELEVTESALMENVEYSVEMMKELSRSGIRWSLDDFGTGYSSLNYLREFPVHVLKVDQSFVRDININPEDAAIVETIIDLAHRLHLTVIAEGVENEEQLKTLARMNCEQVQGYYYSKPMVAEEFVKYLESQT